MKTMQLRVSLSFARASDHKLEELTNAVLANLYGNTDFAAPPVTEAVLEGSLTEFTAAMAATAQGGTADTAYKNEKRDALIALMRELAAYVQTAAANNLAKLLSSGFEVVEPVHTQHPLDPPVVKSVQPGPSGVLTLILGTVRNARSYQVDVALLDETGVPGEFHLGALSTRARDINVPGLLPGRRYAVRVRAIGGSTGKSDWSLTVNQWVI